VNKSATLLRGEQVHLVPFAETHVEDPDYLKWLTDPDVYRYIGRDEYFQKLSQDDLRRYADEMWGSPFISFFAVYASETNRFIGTAKVNFMHDRFRQSGIADLGVMIGERSYWGQRLSIDILRTIAIHAFDDLAARKLTAGAFSLNVAVIKAFLRLGFKEEACLRKQLAVADGYCDHILLSCFEPELIRGRGSMLPSA
jgi:[ribosomal protein S5]-alanine N-acetyltransferase